MDRRFRLPSAVIFIIVLQLQLSGLTSTNEFGTNKLDENGQAKTTTELIDNIKDVLTNNSFDGASTTTVKFIIEGKAEPAQREGSELLDGSDKLEFLKRKIPPKVEKKKKPKKKKLKKKKRVKGKDEEFEEDDFDEEVETEVEDDFGDDEDVEVEENVEIDDDGFDEEDEFEEDLDEEVNDRFGVIRLGNGESIAASSSINIQEVGVKNSGGEKCEKPECCDGQVPMFVHSVGCKLRPIVDGKCVIIDGEKKTICNAPGFAVCINEDDMPVDDCDDDDEDDDSCDDDCWDDDDDDNTTPPDDNNGGGNNIDGDDDVIINGDNNVVIECNSDQKPAYKDKDGKVYDIIAGSLIIKNGQIVDLNDKRMSGGGPQVGQVICINIEGNEGKPIDIPGIPELPPDIPAPPKPPIDINCRAGTKPFWLSPDGKRHQIFGKRMVILNGEIVDVRDLIKSRAKGKFICIEEPTTPGDWGGTEDDDGDDWGETTEPTEGGGGGWGSGSTEGSSNPFDPSKLIECIGAIISLKVGIIAGVLKGIINVKVAIISSGFMFLMNFCKMALEFFCGKFGSCGGGGGGGGGGDGGDEWSEDEVDSVTNVTNWLGMLITHLTARFRQLAMSFE